MYPLFTKSGYSLKHPFRSVSVFFREIKWAFQRIRRGYSDYDAEDPYVWMQSVIPDLLRGFRRELDEIPSFPIELMINYYEEHKEEIGCSFNIFLCVGTDPHIKEWQDRMETECSRKWKDTIDEMIFLFSESDEETCQKKALTDTDLYEYRKECRAKAFALLEKWYEQLGI